MNSPLYCLILVSSERKKHHSEANLKCKTRVVFQITYLYCEICINKLKENSSSMAAKNMNIQTILWVV